MPRTCRPATDGAARHGYPGPPMSEPILIQGMRRSGTTILYDALLEDPGLHCFYEPLREEGDTPGGGSGARESDPFAETRALRRAFRDANYPDLDLEDFNCGGPGNPALELGPELPAHCEAFLRTLLERDEPVMVKETRFYDKLDAIRGDRARGLGARPRRPRPALRRRLDDDGPRPQAGRPLHRPRRLLRRGREAQALVEPRSSPSSC